MAVITVPSIVMSHWSVMSRPRLAMSLTLLARSVPASASYTRTFAASSASNR